MKKALLFFLLPAFLSAATIVTDVWFSEVTATTFTAHIVTNGGGFGAVELFYAIPPNDCTLATGGANTRFSDGDLYYPGIKDPYQDSYISSTGKMPDTTYNVCVAVNAANVWTMGPMKQVHMKSAPGGGYRIPDHATRIDTTYPSDLTTNVQPIKIADDCSDFYEQFSAAVARQQTQNTVLSLPVGQHCTGTVFLDQTPFDVKGLNASNINPDGSMRISGHGWVTGQAIVFARKDYSGDIPNGLVKFGVNGSDGRLYYIQTKGSDPDNFWVYAQPPLPGVAPLKLTPDGNNFNVVAYPRQLKWIVVRTATPDDQFAPPGVSLGSLSWLPKMAYFTNPIGNHGRNGWPILGFADQGNDSRRQSLLAKVRFIGINWTVADDPASYTTVDPPAWDMFLNLQATMQDIIIDRCVFMTPSQHQRVYSVLNWNGLNNAMIHSYFDKTIAYFFPRNSGSVHQ